MMKLKDGINYLKNNIITILVSISIILIILGVSITIVNKVNDAVNNPNIIDDIQQCSLSDPIPTVNYISLIGFILIASIITYYIQRWIAIC